MDDLRALASSVNQELVLWHLLNKMGSTKKGIFGSRVPLTNWGNRLG